LGSVEFSDISNFLRIYARLAGRLESERQKDVAEALGITQSYINNLLAVAKGKKLTKGPTTLPYKQLIEWALTHNVSIDWLLTGQEPVPGPQAASQGRDWINLPAHDQRPLDDQERGLLEKAVVVLRSPEGQEYPPSVALKGTVMSLWETATKQGKQGGAKKGLAKTA